MMDTDTMELHTNEMEKVNGGGPWPTVAMIIATGIERYKERPCIGYEPCGMGGAEGFFRGAWKGIFGRY